MHYPKKGKLIIFSAPSGAGKTTLVHHVLNEMPEILAFSVSCTTRAPRLGEVHGRDYYFISLEAFKEKIREGAFVEWEEVYENAFYGTLKQELFRIWEQGKHVVFDVDVLGGIHLKNRFADNSLALFVQPPSLSVLSERLKQRKTETTERLKQRLTKAEQELQYANRFDDVLVNDHLARAKRKSIERIKAFLNEEENTKKIEEHL